MSLARLVDRIGHQGQYRYMYYGVIETEFVKCLTAILPVDQRGNHRQDNGENQGGNVAHIVKYDRILYSTFRYPIGATLHLPADGWRSIHVPNKSARTKTLLVQLGQRIGNQVATEMLRFGAVCKAGSASRGWKTLGQYTAQPKKFDTRNSRWRSFLGQALYGGAPPPFGEIV